jgi:hypothetical protein
MTEPGHVILVSGPPCAGKNHHIDHHRTPDDVVLDYDAMGPRAYNHAINKLTQRTTPPTHTTWVIRCLPGPTTRQAFATRIQADRVIHLAPNLDTLITRARQRPQPGRVITAIKKWMSNEQQDKQPVPDPAPAPRTRW